MQHSVEVKKRKCEEQPDLDEIMDPDEEWLRLEQPREAHRAAQHRVWENWEVQNYVPELPRQQRVTVVVEQQLPGGRRQKGRCAAIYHEAEHFRLQSRFVGRKCWGRRRQLRRLRGAALEKTQLQGFRTWTMWRVALGLLNVVTTLMIRLGVTQLLQGRCCRLTWWFERDFADVRQGQPTDGEIEDVPGDVV